MKAFFHPARIAFYVLMLFVFFILGLYYAAWIEAGKHQGLAGGAIVLGYGVGFGGIAFLIALGFANRLAVTLLKKINWILLIVLLLTVSYKYYEFQQRDLQQAEQNKAISLII